MSGALVPLVLVLAQVSSPGTNATLSTATEGIDVSHHSGTVDWTVVAASGQRFAFAKATEGLDDADPLFPANWPAMASAGLHRGAYHFFVTEDDPVGQADFFLATAKLQPLDLLPVVDIETVGQGTTGDLAGKLRTFLHVVEAAIGAKPIIYTDTNFWNANFDDSFGDYPLWVAEYDVESPKLPKGWTAWALWQYEEDATISGVASGADRSRVGPGMSIEALRIPATK